MLHVTSSPRGRLIASSMNHIIFIKTEHITIDEIGRIIYAHLLLCAHRYFYIKLLCMNDAVTCNIVAHYSAVQLKFKSQTTYLPTLLSWECVWTVFQKLLIRAHCAPLFSLQQCSLVGIRLDRWRPTIRMKEA